MHGIFFIFLCRLLYNFQFYTFENNFIFKKGFKPKNSGNRLKKKIKKCKCNNCFSLNLMYQKGIIRYLSKIRLGCIYA